MRHHHLKNQAEAYMKSLGEGSTWTNKAGIKVGCSVKYDQEYDPNKEVS